jgi:trehalose-6-phosphatase
MHIYETTLCDFPEEMFLIYIVMRTTDVTNFSHLQLFCHFITRIIALPNREFRNNLQFQVCKEGAWVENKGAVLTFHYRETPTYVRAEIVPQACKLIESHGFKIGVSHCALEARPPVAWNKGRASIYILRTAFGYNWSERIRIIYAGDDVTDEDAMQVSLISRFNVTVSYLAVPYTCILYSFTLSFCHEINQTTFYFTQSILGHERCQQKM